MMNELLAGEGLPVDISEQDVFEAMKQIGGYIDITPREFREVFQAAYALAVKRLLNTLTAANIMTRSVVTVAEEMPLVRAAALLAEKRISGAPVIKSAGEIIGVVSEKDFLREMGVGRTPSFLQIATHCLNDKSCMVGWQAAPQNRRQHHGAACDNRYCGVEDRRDFSAVCRTGK